MKRSLGRLFAALGLLAWACAVASAGPGQTGGILLQTPFGARPFALGEAYAAIGDDVFGMAYNPATLSRLRKSQFATEFVQSFSDVRMGYAGAATPLSPHQALGISLAYLNGGNIDLFDANGASIGGRSLERDYLVTMGYGYAMGIGAGKLDLGASAKVLRSAVVDEVSGTAFATDWGGLYQQSLERGQISGAVVVSNAGPGLRYSGGKASGGQTDSLPLATRLALGYSRPAFDSDRLVAGLEIDRVFGDAQQFEAMGFEYSYHGVCALRFGYRFGNDASGVRLGLGLRVMELSFDYGLELSSTFNNVQHLSLNYNFAIPGIRYGESTPPSPRETMVRRISDFISAKRYFNAASELERLQAFFPDSPDIIRFNQQIRAEIDAILANGTGSPRFAYALGFRNIQEKQWQEAVVNLENASLAEFDRSEVKKALILANNRRNEQQRQSLLQQQARTGTLFELADQAFESGDYSRADRILDEILRLGRYQPAENLRRKIRVARRVDQAPPPRVPSLPPTTAEPSAADVAKAEKLYYAALKEYAENHLQQALDDLYQALKLTPSNKTLRTTLDSIESEYQHRPKSDAPAGGGQ